MRKSERMRILELQMVRMEMQIEILNAAFNSVIESSNTPMPDLDAQKWYKRESE
jgi:hypothetical protein